MKWFLIFFVLTACSQEKVSIFPFPKYPEGKKPSVLEIKLGEKLFNDPILSIDSTIACASCHQSNNSYSAPQKVGKGIHGNLGSRNIPTLINVLWQPIFMAEGGLNSLEKVSLAPIQDSVEMGLSFPLLIERLNQNKFYQLAFNKAFHRSPDPYSLVKALAAFQRNIIVTNAKFDQWARGEENLFNSSELRGWELFKGKAKCQSCHPAPLFTDFRFHQIIQDSSDFGRFRIDPNPKIKYSFKTPTLRGITKSAPYFHNGSAATLTEVIAQYQHGIPHQANIQLSPSEVQDLVHFLCTLGQ
jgi:cytochrome c peroxidase